MAIKLVMMRNGKLHVLARTHGQEITGNATGQTMIVQQLPVMQIGTPATGTSNVLTKTL